LTHPRLTSLSHGGGCACKISSADLGKILGALPPVHDPAVLVGTDTRDDAAVVRVGPPGQETGIVSTVDIFTPIVDDPRDYGRIAATNAISDIYAMGARPLFALSFVGFPTKTLPMSVLAEILGGAAAICAEAGIAIVGGHSIDDAEPKFGLAVTGVVDPARIVRNSTARPGDVLVLTKAIGTGAISQAIKAGRAPADAVAAAVASMTTLNRAACSAMVDVGVHAATDVTGFGLLGHLYGMVSGSRVAARISAERMVFLPGARELAAENGLSGGSRRNAEHYWQFVRFGGAVDPTTRALLFDAQTSGGLLMAVAPEKRDNLMTALAAQGVNYVQEIGEIVAESSDLPSGFIAVT
jgi:selenide,water dikinase